MGTVQVLVLLLAMSGAANVALGAGITARLAGASRPQAVLTGAGALGSVMAVFFTAIAAYH